MQYISLDIFFDWRRDSNRRVFNDGEQLAGQLNDLHGFLKDLKLKDRDIQGELPTLEDFVDIIISIMYETNW